MIAMKYRFPLFAMLLMASLLSSRLSAEAIRIDVLRGSNHVSSMSETEIDEWCKSSQIRCESNAAYLRLFSSYSLVLHAVPVDVQNVKLSFYNYLGEPLFDQMSCDSTSIFAGKISHRHQTPTSDGRRSVALEFNCNNQVVVVTAIEGLPASEMGENVGATIDGNAHQFSQRLSLQNIYLDYYRKP